MKYIKDMKGDFVALVRKAIRDFGKDKNVDKSALEAIAITTEVPKDNALGDIAAPVFLFSKVFHLPPAAISKGVADLIGKSDLGEARAMGGYVNFFYDKSNLIFSTLKNIKDDSFSPTSGEGGGVTVIEFSSPNTNKPLHLGHLRNDALGESVVQILRATGQEVKAVDLINDRGVHICQSMLAFQLFHSDKDCPDATGEKGDHFVGKCYVEFSQYSKDHSEIKDKAEEMLVAWERGDKDVRALWKRMNDWAIGGIKETYRRTGIEFDKYYKESETYKAGKDIVEQGLKSGVFFRAEDNSVRCDVTEVTGAGKAGEPRQKVLLRSDGTSVYITQDLGTAVARKADYDFSKMIYVVASEQRDHFKMLFFLLKKLGFEWAGGLRHLSYGLVNLPSGRMKSREGTVVDADDLLDELRESALAIVKEKGYVSGCAAADTAEKIALGAVNYYLLSQTPQKDMTFNPSESLSFNGNTGPYLQYMGSRLSSITEKAKLNKIDASFDHTDLLTDSSEIALSRHLSYYPGVLSRAAEALDPSVLCQYTYDLCKAFSAFYSQCPVITAESEDLGGARLLLVECTLKVLKSAMNLILVPFLDKM